MDRTLFYGYKHPLSNMHRCRFTDENGTTYYSTEQYFQYQKYKGVCKKIASDILNAKSPFYAKRLGRTRHSEFNVKRWDSIKDEVMLRGLRYKFNADENLKTILIKTGTSRLLECSPTDYYWGTGCSISNYTDRFKGKNTTGRLLERVRSEVEK